MKNKKESNPYISCTDKRVVIVFLVSIIILIVTSFLLYRGGFAPGILKENRITGIIYWVLILLLCYVSFLSSITTATVFLFGIIGNCYLNRKSIQNRKAIMGLPKNKEIKVKLERKADLLQFFDEEAVMCTVRYDGNKRIHYHVKVEFEIETDEYDRFLDVFSIE